MTAPTPAPDLPVLAEIAAGQGLSLTQAARRLPSARAGRPVHSSCVWRWITAGVRLPSGEVLRLEAARLAGRWLTTTPALARFLARQTPAAAPLPPAKPRTAGQRQRAADRAGRALDRIGI